MKTSERRRSSNNWGWGLERHTQKHGERKGKERKWEGRKVGGKKQMERQVCVSECENGEEKERNNYSCEWVWVLLLRFERKWRSFVCVGICSTFGSTSTMLTNKRYQL
jgi:hypothetical protein